MPGRLPLSEDFPPYLHFAITPPPKKDQPVNVLILLHGLGDTNAPFTLLATRLALPETCCISLRGPAPLPFELGGFHWGDELAFDPATIDMELDTGFSKSMRSIGQILIRESLMEKCGYQARDIMLFGFGQGGMAALAVAASISEELGGVVSIGGPASVSVQSPSEKSKTPVLMLGGASRTHITKASLERTKEKYQHVEYHKWPTSGDGMPKDREEMMPIMRFFSRRLRSRKDVPEGSVEVG